MKKLAHVLEVNGNRISVLVRRSSGCNSCEKSAACGTGQVNQMLDSPAQEIELTSNLDVKPGEPVLLVMPDNLYRNLAFKAYGLPLGGFLLGALAGTALALRWGWPADLLAFVLGVSAGWLGLRLGRWWTESDPRSQQPFTLEKIHPDF